MKKNKQILLSWDAFNNGFVVTAKTIMLLAENYNIFIDEIKYLQNNTLQAANMAEIDVFFKNKKLGSALSEFADERIQNRIRACYEISDHTEKLPNFKNININIKNVTDYQSIYDNLVRFIKKEFYHRANFDLHINVSPGTPHMHVVWLMMNSAGFLPTNTTLWSSQWIKERQDTVLNKVNFKPRTFLSEVLKTKYLKAHLPKINPNETKSEKRQEAEQKIQLFSHIPKAPILLLGERGTGKSTYARTLIKRNQNSNLPFVELACGTFSEELMRSELFGHVKGAFTGATDEKKGILTKFVKGGILFLDEIHDLSKPLQRQLMQVLQTGEYYAVGAEESKKTDFRLITASNLSFSELSNERLDADFLDRIARFVIEIPPLRHCREDIKVYWEKVWEEVADFEAAPELIWNKELQHFLKTEALAGNFRDLQKIASYIIAFYFETKIKADSVFKALNEYEKWKQRFDNKEQRSYFMRYKTHEEIVALFEKDLTKWAIKEYGGKKEAAKILERSIDMLNKYLKLNRLIKR